MISLTFVQQILHSSFFSQLCLLRAVELVSKSIERENRFYLNDMLEHELDGRLILFSCFQIHRSRATEHER